MNPEVKKKWLTALRSGKYRQGTDCLKQEGADGRPLYCCLGVLCDLYVQEVGGRFSEPQPEIVFCDVTGESREAIPPQDVVKWAQLRHAVGNRVEGDELESLANYNDDGHSFEEIAEIIEAKL